MLLRQGKQIINIDKTWLPIFDLSRRSCSKRGYFNTIPSKYLSHRVNMLVAIDTDGQLYLGLTQQNTDTEVMLMFMSYLVHVLSNENKNWR